MAATVALGVGSEPAVARVPGSRRAVNAVVTFDTSYPSGGYALTAAQFGLVQLDFVQANMDQSGTYFGVWVTSTSKLQLFTASATENVTADIHTKSMVVTAYGL